MSCDQNLPKFSQFVTCSTRLEKNLDLFYCNIKQSYKCQKLPAIGKSDHNMLHMLPSYKQKLKSVKAITKDVKVWDSKNIENLKACFDWTNWEVFLSNENNLDYITDVISSYILFCVDCNIPSKTIKIYGNSKPWVNKELRSKFKEKSIALKQQDREKLQKVQTEIDVQVRACKKQYKDKIEQNFATNNARQAWQDLKNLTGYSLKKDTNINVHLEELNDFYARFDDRTNKWSYPETDQSHYQYQITFNPEEVCKQFRSVNSRKAAGPDGLSSNVIKLCAEQLSTVFCGLFNRAINDHIPQKWKEACIIPVPKSVKASEKNDFRPVALTSVPMKCLERLILKQLKQFTEQSLDTLQFAYRPKRGTEDALLTFYELVSQHLSKPNRYVRVLMIDFSSAFNTVLPVKLIETLRSTGTPEILCKFIWDFLTMRTQYVQVDKNRSKSVEINTGSPKGCVMSAYLFSLYTNNCRSTQECCHVIKYADDTAIIGLIADDLEHEKQYRRQIDDTVKWCKNNNLILNTKKTKELIYDLRKSKHNPIPVTVNNEM